MLVAGADLRLGSTRYPCGILLSGHIASLTLCVSAYAFTNKTCDYGVLTLTYFGWDAKPDLTAVLIARLLGAVFPGCQLGSASRRLHDVHLDTISDTTPTKLATAPSTRTCLFAAINSSASIARFLGASYQSSVSKLRCKKSSASRSKSSYSRSFFILTPCAFRRRNLMSHINATIRTPAEFLPSGRIKWRLRLSSTPTRLATTAY